MPLLLKVLNGSDHKLTEIIQSEVHTLMFELKGVKGVSQLK